MGSPTVHVSAIALTILVAGCGTSSSTASPLEVTDGAISFEAVSGPPLIPAWLTTPEELPPAFRGRNNCTFKFGQATAQWDFHPDGGCWERPGPDGWTRQQQYKIHVPQHLACGGGAGDVSPIRVCRAPGEEDPCPINPLTGPTGCALCVASLTCR